MSMLARAVSREFITYFEALPGFRAVRLADRTRSGVSGLLGSCWAVSGAPLSSGKSLKLFDFAGESGTFSVTGCESPARFNSSHLIKHLSKTASQCPFAIMTLAIEELAPRRNAMLE
jgi:hypothetical protein